MPGLKLDNALAAMKGNVTARLDTLDKAVPPRRELPELPFAEYVQQARAVAAADPIFRRQFEDAMRQYEQIQQAQGGNV